jgi:hypothetical protein
MWLSGGWQLLSQALGQSVPHQRCIPRLHVIIRFDHAAAALLATDFPSRLALLTTTTGKSETHNNRMYLHGLMAPLANGCRQAQSR